MKGQYVGSISRIYHEVRQLQAVSFQEALEDYRDTVGGGRIRSIAYRFNSCDLIKKISGYFGVEMFRSASHTNPYCGDKTLRILYKGIPYIIVVDDESCETLTAFEITEEY